MTNLFLYSNYQSYYYKMRNSSVFTLEIIKLSSRSDTESAEISSHSNKRLWATKLDSLKETFSIKKKNEDVSMQKQTSKQSEIPSNEPTTDEEQSTKPQSETQTDESNSKDEVDKVIL